MKKLLSILASVGLTATAATSVVACTASISANDVNILQNGYVSISDKKIDLPAELTATGTDVNLADTLKLSAFDDKGNALDGVKGLTINLTKATTKSTKKDKSVKVNISFFLGTDLPTKKNMTIKLGTAKGNGKLDFTAVKISAKTPIEWDNATYGEDGTVTFITTTDLKDSSKPATVDASSFTIKDAKGDSVTPASASFDKDKKQLTITFKAKETREDQITQQLAYSIDTAEGKDTNLSFTSGSAIFTIPANGLPLNPSDNSGTSGVKPDADGNVTTTFKASFKEVPTSEQLAQWFAIEGPDGNPVSGATYRFTKDGNQNYVLVAGVSGTVTVKFKPTASAGGTATFTINKTNAAGDNVTGFTPVKVTVDTPSNPTPSGDVQDLSLTYDDIANADPTDWATLQADPTWKNDNAETKERANIGVALNKLIMSKLSDAQKATFKDKLKLDDSSDLSKDMAFWWYESTDTIGKQAKEIGKDGKIVKTTDPVLGGELDAWWLQKDGTMTIPTEYAKGTKFGQWKPGDRTSNKYEFVITSTEGEKATGGWQVLDLHVTINPSK